MRVVEYRVRAVDVVAIFMVLCGAPLFVKRESFASPV